MEGKNYKEAKDKGLSYVSRRNTLLGAIAAGMSITDMRSAKAESVCACLPAPKCEDICEFGGKPRGGGTQDCVCFDEPVQPTIKVIDAYPVHSLYISFNNTDPGTLFGGKWEALPEGYFLIGAGTAYPAGSTGGEKTHTLTVSEMPSHTHSGSTDTDGSHYHGSGWGEHTSTGNPAQGWYNTSNSQFGSRGGVDYDNSQTRTTSGGSHTHSATIDNAGGGGAHENMSPYIAAYVWKRIE